MTTRRSKIEAMLAADPEDTFLLYSLAMEEIKAGESKEGISRLERLTHADPPYVPAFFMAAQTLAAQGAIDRAREFLRRGIEQARAQGDAHAAGEMAELLASLGGYGESIP